MKKLEVKEATASLAEYTNTLKQEPIIVVSDGKPIAVLFSIEGASIDAETLSLSTNPHFMHIIEESRKSHREEGGISSEEMRKQLGLK